MTRFSFVCCAALCAAIPLLPAWAQAQDKDPKKPPAPPVAAAPSGGQTLLYINDLGVLKALAPLKMTEEQATKVAAELKAVAAEGEKRRKADEEALKAVAGDVAKAREAVLKGEVLPEELEKRVEQMFKDSAAKAAEAKAAAMARVLAALKANLSETQLTTIEAQTQKALGGRLVPTQYRSDPSKAPKEEVRDLMVSAFIERVFFNERAVEILQNYKPAAPKPAP